MNAKERQELFAKAFRASFGEKTPSEIELSQKEAENFRRKEWQQRVDLQRWLPSFVACLVVIWIMFVIAVTFLAGWEILNYHASVLVTLLGSATASIIGLLIRVVGYALPRKEERQ